MTQAEKLDNPVIPVDGRKLPSFDETTATAKEIGSQRHPANPAAGDSIKERFRKVHTEIRPIEASERRRVARHTHACFP
ncbi:hypothetical protein ACFYUJ_36385 [Streptomyces sp. NPDC004520]|uniref:hypothetical protein n=1 Tax=Streptomyces sp. NPDC004520 TaxID=3364702 RepID=UPI003689E675